MKRALFLALSASLVSSGAASSASAETLLEGILDILVDGGNDFDWQRVELPGTVCGNGSQYKFFVHDTGSPNLLFFFEGGGACWDYDTCSGRAGVLGAANPNGISDDYMDQFTAKYVSPIVNGADPGLPLRSRTDLVTNGWNIVYMPYCTGDVHIGNRSATYVDPTGQEPPLSWVHSGYTNTLAAANYARDRFPQVNKMLVTGFSAGGTATSSAYYFLRTIIDPVKGYLLNDSGPIYPAPNGDFLSRSLHDQIRESWDLDSVFSELPASFDTDDFGTINRMVAAEFPGDQIAYTGYSEDYNYSRFSYERFLTPNDKESVLSYWHEDTDNFVAELEQYDNASYFIPWHRPINSSHCSTIITFIGSHACQRMEEKHHWWEYLEWPLGQGYKCYSEFVPMETFLERFVNEDRRVRIYEPENEYNNQDPGMSIVAPLIGAALGG
ncbi:pectin acetylesterase-family hydrolase [Haliangium sp.]|uniref:pectin acetylesterase-family hydrolase n=1 Tax=Haliangium sp. TaxID=2663208 RepID=UPI003D0B2ED0